MSAIATDLAQSNEVIINFEDQAQYYRFDPNYVG